MTFHPSAGLYYFSILGGTIFYDSPETVEIYVISGIGTYDNCWDGKSAAIKPLDVCVHPLSAARPVVTEILFCSGLCLECSRSFSFKSDCLPAAAGSLLRLRCSPVVCECARVCARLCAFVCPAVQCILLNAALSRARASPCAQ